VTTFHTMLEWDQSTGVDTTVDAARIRAQALFVSEPFSVNVSIHDDEGNVIEDFGRSPGTNLGAAALAGDKTRKSS
jgi:hypothetical protein